MDLLTCKVWFSSEEWIKLNWGDSFWRNWIEQWVIASIKQLKLSKEDKIKWVNHECEIPMGYEELSQKLTDAQIQKINDAYFEIYAISSRNVVRCPRFGWNYMGIIEEKTWNDFLECEAWHYRWKLPIQMSFLQSTLLY